MTMMPAAYRRSLMPLDLNEDHNHQLFTPNPSSVSSLSRPPILFSPPDQDQQTSYTWEPKHLPSDREEKIIPPSGSYSWDHSAAEKQERDEDGSANSWMSSKMMVSDQTGCSLMRKFEDHGSSNNYSNQSNMTVRVCSDCHTTKTPLWRSGPKGPKSLCNACGIRQRKARRAAANANANANANGAIVVAAETRVKLQNKEKKSKIECPQMKKKRKPSQSRNKFSFEELTLSLSNNLALQKVFPQDEKEAAILLMALSYGLLRG